LKIFSKFKESDNLKTTMRGSDDFEGAPNDELIHQLDPKMPINKVDKTKALPDMKNKLLNNNIKNQIFQQSNSSEGQRGGVKELPPINEGERPKFPIPPPPPPPLDTFQTKGKCNFFSGSCPSGYQSMGGFGFSGLPSGVTFSCGSASIGKQPKLVPEISNGVISNINIVDGGSGFDPTKQYTAKVISKGSGSGAQLETVIDDNGIIKVINIKSGGSGYTSTPSIIIESGDGKTDGTGKCEYCCQV